MDQEPVGFGGELADLTDLDLEDLTTLRALLPGTFEKIERLLGRPGDATLGFTMDPDDSPGSVGRRLH